METNNLSTIATWTGIIVLIIEIICKHFEIVIPHDTIVMFVSGVITFIIAVWSSRNPNTIPWLGNDPTYGPTTTTTASTEIFDNDAPVLNDEYTTGDDDDGC